MSHRIDSMLVAADTALRTLFAAPQASRPCPVVPQDETHLDPQERQLSGALMRVNHVGEVCAQALYASQALATRSRDLREHFEAAARDEVDHLAWTRKRLGELGARAGRRRATRGAAARRRRDRLPCPRASADARGGKGNVPDRAIHLSAPRQASTRQTSITSKLVSIAAVLASIALAEQYFS